MNDRLSLSLETRLVSLALAMVVTVTILVGLETLAPQQLASGHQISQSNATQPA